MKNKRILVVMLLLVMVLLLGIGYAVSNKTLTISGTASAAADDDNFVVRFKKTSDDAGYETPTGLTNATATVTDDKTATIEVTGLKKKDDTATATYTIENKSNDIDASVKAAIKNFTQNTEYFEVTTSGITNTASDLACDNTTTITVTVKLLKTPVEAKSTTFTVELDATPVQK